MTYQTSGVCALQVEFDVEGDILKGVHFIKGCNGNLSGISKLVEGMKIDDVIEKLEGTACGQKDTSCPDQLAKALRLYKDGSLPEQAQIQEPKQE